MPRGGTGNGEQGDPVLRPPLAAGHSRTESGLASTARADEKARENVACAVRFLVSGTMKFLTGQAPRYLKGGGGLPPLGSGRLDGQCDQTNKGTEQAPRY